MNAYAALFLGSLKDTNLEKTFGGKNALEMAIERAAKFPHVTKVFLLCKEGEAPSLQSSANLQVVERPVWDNGALMEALSSFADADFLYYAWADSPFLDITLAENLAKRHLDYPADYSYADGFPAGLAPELIAPKIAGVFVKLLEKDEKLKQKPVSRDSLFLTLQKDINSFDIETELSPVDFSTHRISLTADSPRNLLLCNNFWADELAALQEKSANTDYITELSAYFDSVIQEKPALLRTLPAFFQIQVTDRCPATPSCEICPYKTLAKNDGGREMSAASFSALLDKIADFAGDAVIDISLWGEAALHSERGALIKAVLARPSLSLIVETALCNWDEAEVSEYAKRASEAPSRVNGMAPLSWIVSAPFPSPDNPEPDCVFARLFPADSYMQMVRKRGNEDDVEKFYRYWKKRGANVIIQKYDSFLGTLPNLTTADLSPVDRRPCWHIMRDFVIALDGTVSACRESVGALDGGALLGNALTEDLASIWDAGCALYLEHCGGKYGGDCGKCDEWYTYNF